MHFTNLIYRMILVVLCLPASWAYATETKSTTELASPAGNIKIAMNIKKDNSGLGAIYFKVDYLNGVRPVEVLPFSALGIKRSDEAFTSNMIFKGASQQHRVIDDYTLSHGKRAHCHNEANEKTFHFTNNHAEPLDIIFRVYNNGVTFRYYFPKLAASSAFVTDETTTFVVPNSTKRWMQSFNPAYEDFFPLNTSGKDSLRNKQDWGFPALFNVRDKPYWVLISEADVSRSNCASHLNNRGNSEKYKIAMPDERIAVTDGWKSPWRVMIIGKLADIVESTLITDVATPCKLKDTTWIKPGSASWVYWSNNHGSKDYKKIVEFADLAAYMHWPYTLIDWEWNQMGNGGNIEKAVKYANSIGVKPLLWYNSGDSLSTGGGLGPYGRLLTHEARVKEFAWLNRIGVYGIKVDFFEGDQQKVMSYYIDLMEDAAQYHLMINFHGATVPKGWERTYPNLMSMEAVYGAEWYNNKADLTEAAGAHNTTLPFTRNVVGPMDYTPVTFTNSQHPHITSFAHELALAVVFESGIQHFADRPKGYLDLPDAPRKFLMGVPTNWDDTKLLAGYPGQKVLIARQKGDKWYIGALNGSDIKKEFILDLKFLGEDRYNLQLISDGNDERSFSTRTLQVDKSSKLSVSCLARGGFVATLSIRRK